MNIAGTGDLKGDAVENYPGYENTVEFLGDLGTGTGGVEVEAVRGSGTWEMLKDDAGAALALVTGQGVGFWTGAARWRPTITGAVDADATVLVGVKQV